LIVMDRSTRLRQFIEREGETLRGTLRLYLYRAGLPESPDDLLNDVVVEALRHEGRFRPDGQPRAWLLGIAANLIKRRGVERARRERREPLLRDLYGGTEEVLSDDELFDWLASLTGSGQSDELPPLDVDIQTLLACVSDDDRRVLTLAILHGLDGEALARALGTTPGAARVRLHRALRRLRDAAQGGDYS
jgi:RNA polymerase sigma factor (sigma-70 family)